jgi:hypothetical protein
MLMGPKELLSLYQLEDPEWKRLELGIMLVKFSAEPWIGQEIPFMLEICQDCTAFK